MFALLDNIRAMIGIDDFLIALALDLDDGTCNNQPVKERLKGYDNLTVFWGLSTSKINAINRSIPMNTPWKYLIVVADDFWFVVKEFGKQIISDFEKYFPDGDGLVHYPDGHVGSKLITLPVMGRRYYERTNYVYHPDYISVKADMEQQEVAKRLERYKYVDVQIAEHKHPRWGYGKMDDQLSLQDSPANYARDGATYHVRLTKGFYL
jgi:hypothetical protein